MGLPIVAIIGRPNVGKSSLLNALAGQRISIVEPTAGVTRDRISTIIARNNRYFELIDTGGYCPGRVAQPQPDNATGYVARISVAQLVEQQILRAIESANLVLFLVDIREGLMPLDKEIAQLLHKHGPRLPPPARGQACPREIGGGGEPVPAKAGIIGVANKADSAKMFPAAAEFSSLGFGEFLCVSAKNNLNIAVLLDRIFEKLGSVETGKPSEPIMKLAIVGKRNVGKSSLLNAIVGCERVIVSETPGTTRDAVDVRFEKDGKTITVIDTAGIRKKGKMADSIEFYSYVRAIDSIRRADVVLFLIDATEPVSQVDKKIADFIAQEHKSCIIVINKWDLAKDSAVSSDYEQYLTEKLPGLSYAPIAFTTATTAKNVQSVLDLSAEIFKQTTTQIPTAKLNKVFEKIMTERLVAAKRGTGVPKIYYASQIADNPITILMFINNPKLFDENYRRFITGRLRQLLPISEVPIKLLARSHRKSKITN